MRNDTYDFAVTTLDFECLPRLIVGISISINDMESSSSRLLLRGRLLLSWSSDIPLSLAELLSDETEALYDVGVLSSELLFSTSDIDLSFSVDDPKRPSRSEPLSGQPVLNCSKYLSFPSDSLPDAFKKRETYEEPLIKKNHYLHLSTIDY